MWRIQLIAVAVAMNGLAVLRRDARSACNGGGGIDGFSGSARRW